MSKWCVHAIIFFFKKIFLERLKKFYFYWICVYFCCFQRNEINFNLSLYIYFFNWNKRNFNDNILKITVVIANPNPSIQEDNTWSPPSKNCFFKLFNVTDSMKLSVERYLPVISEDLKYTSICLCTVGESNFLRGGSYY